MMINEESTEIVSFMTSGAGGSVPGFGQKSHILGNHCCSSGIDVRGFRESSSPIVFYHLKQYLGKPVKDGYTHNTVIAIDQAVKDKSKNKGIIHFEPFNY